MSEKPGIFICVVLLKIKAATQSENKQQLTDINIIHLFLKCKLFF